ncbi:MAG: hypothetical protein CVU52_03855 [Deltaproteobacteria bacterium HGW-Deltaproteobacteria-10]|nr:MAG: hypothetical protein CVU52_03855 [Deltaproteobacteria bacterium HGW-Deltaproteobacteria-10]
MLASLKLIDLVEKNAEAIAQQWVEVVKKNERTPHYHGLPSEKLVQQSVEFYRQLRRMLMSSNTFEETQDYFLKYAKACYEEGIPLHEAIYAVVLMRRQMWLYAEFQATFITVVEHQQALDSITRTILVMDYAVYRITQHYLDLQNK